MAEEIIDIRLFLRGAREAEAQLMGTARAADKLGTAGKRAGAEGATGLARFAKHADTINRVGTRMTHMFTLPLLGAAAAGVKFSVDFQKQMEMIHTEAGASQSEVKRLGGQVLDLAKTTSQGPNELAKGLYHLESVGIRGAGAMRALKLAAQGASVSGANLEETTTALASAWRVGIKGAGGLHHIMATLNATAGAGNMRMQDLVTSLGTGVLPAAKAAGLSLQDPMAALAVLTDEGWQGSSAMAQFSTALHFLFNPTKKATDAMDAMGLKSSTLAEDMHKPHGLLVALRTLHSHLQEAGKQSGKELHIGLNTTLPKTTPAVREQQLLGSILPGGRGRVMMVLLNQLNVLDKKYKQIEGTTSHFSDSVRKTQETDAFKLKNAWSKVQVALIQVGDALRPALVPILAGLATGFSALATVFTAMPTPLKVVTIGLLALVAIGGPMLIFTASILKAVKDLKEMKAVLGGGSGMAGPFRRFKRWLVGSSAAAGVEAGAAEGTGQVAGGMGGRFLGKFKSAFRRFKRWLIGASAAAGAEAGVAEGAAMAGGMTGAGMLGKFKGVGLLIGKVLGGAAIASMIAQITKVENADPLLFLHPPAAGDPRPGHGDIQPTHGAVSWLQKHHVGSIPAGMSPEQWARRHGWRGRRHGGPVWPGNSYLVGEAGLPEIFTPQTAGRVDRVDSGSGVSPLTPQGSRPEAHRGDMVANLVVDGKHLARAVFKHADDAKARQ